MSDRKNQPDRKSQEKAANRRLNHSTKARPEPSINLEELQELIALLRENGLAEFELEREGFRVRLRRDVGSSATTAPADSQRHSTPAEKTGPVSNLTPASTASAAAQSNPSHPGAHAESKASEDQDLHIIHSPIVGTFYRSTSPNTEPFVKIGSQVVSDTVVCIIEAMKLMNEIQAETSGEVAKIYVENGQPVEYGQPLFGIKR